MLFRKVIFTVCGLLPACVIIAQNQTTKGSPVADKIIAVVGDHIILSSEIKNATEDLVRRGINPSATTNCRVVEEAVISKLLLAEALKDSLLVTDDDVEAELDRRSNAHFIDPMYEDEYEKIKAKARLQIKEALLIETMRQKIVAGIKITPVEVRSYFEKIPKDGLPLVEPELEVGRIVFYPAASKDLEQYVIDGLNEYKRKVENKITNFCPLTGDACAAQKINRNNKQIEQVILSAIFRLKEGEISAPVKGRLGFYLIQMEERKGDDAFVKFVYKPLPVTDVEINEAKAQLNKLRTEIIEKRISFNEAASKYSDDNSINFSGPFFLNRNGSPYITLDQLETDLAATVSKMDIGEVSRPMFFVDEQNRKGVRLIYLKSRTSSHILNLKDDYVKISQLALERKKEQALDKWISAKLSSHYVMIDEATAAACPEIQRFANKN